MWSSCEKVITCDHECPTLGAWKRNSERCDTSGNVEAEKCVKDSDDCRYWDWREKDLCNNGCSDGDCQNAGYCETMRCVEFLIVQLMRLGLIVGMILPKTIT